MDRGTGFAGPMRAAPDAAGWSAAPNYRDPKGLGIAILACLGVYLAVTTVNMVLGDFGLAASDQGASFRQSAEGPLGFLGMGLLIALAVLTPLWLARVHRNAEALGGTPLRGSPGWTAGAWFIPFVGGFLVTWPLARIWARTPGGSAVLPVLWGSLWSLWQIAVLVLLVTIMAMTMSRAQEEANGGQLSEAEAQAIADEVVHAVGPFGLAVSVLLLLAGIAMLLTVYSINKSQGQRAPRAGKFLG